MITPLIFLVACQVPPPAPDALNEALRRGAAKKAVVVVSVGADWCEPCQRLQKRLEGGWKGREDVIYVHIGLRHPMAGDVFGVQNYDPQNHPDIPCTAVTTGGTAVKPRWGFRVTGDVSVREMERRLRIRPKKAPVKPRGTISGGWTWPGSPSAALLERHLAESPHNYDPAYLRTLSDSQLVTLHDAWHNRYGARPAKTGTMQRRRVFRGR